MDIYRPTNGIMNIDYNDYVDVYSFDDYPAQLFHFTKLWDGNYRIVLKGTEGGVENIGCGEGCGLEYRKWDWNNTSQIW